MKKIRPILLMLLLLIATMLSTRPVQAQSVRVTSFQKISDTEGGFTGTLRSLDLFGTDVVNIGDLDHDGVPDLAISGHDDDGGFDRGAVWILFMNTDGTVRAHQKISDLEGEFTGVLDDEDVFGAQISALGDLDGDGIVDIAACAPGDDDGGERHGAIWVLFLNTDGTVKSHQKISDTEGNLNAELEFFDGFAGKNSIGDLNEDGVVDLAAGSYRKNKMWILFLNTDGTVRNHQVVSATEGGFSGDLNAGDSFGGDIADAGDINGDGITDLIVSAAGTSNGGAVWILFMNKNGTVSDQLRISENEGGFTDDLAEYHAFGASVAGVGDLNQDGIPDVAVGANHRLSQGEPNTGDAWILFLNKDGTVKASQKISEGSGGFTGNLDNGDDFGSAIAGIGDLNGDGVPDLAVGALADDDGGSNRGAVWLMFLDVPAVHNFTLIDASTDQPVSGYDPILNEAILNLKTLPAFLNIRANTSGYVESVRFAFLGDYNFRVENESPYALFGDTNGDFFAGKIRLGLQKLIAVPFTEDGAQGETGNRARISFTVIRDQYGMGVSRFMLVNADTDEDIYQISEGDELDLSSLPAHLNLRADVVGPVQSVRFLLEPRRHKANENLPPYALFGDSEGNYAAGQFFNGKQTLTAYPFSKTNGQGQVGTPLSIHFSVINGTEAPGAIESDMRPSLFLHNEPEEMIFDAAYPNPFNLSTTIRFGVPRTGHIQLVVYDVLGRAVETLVDGVVENGMHDVVFDAGNLPTGTYLIRLVSANEIRVGRMLLIK